jgi:hypothetical protein
VLTFTPVLSVSYCARRTDDRSGRKACCDRCSWRAFTADRRRFRAVACRRSPSPPSDTRRITDTTHSKRQRPRGEH